MRAVKVQVKDCVLVLAKTEIVSGMGEASPGTVGIIAEISGHDLAVMFEEGTNGVVFLFCRWKNVELVK